LLCSTAVAEKRVAFVIGNGTYANVSKLPNPTRDADAMEALFRKAGFDVVEAKKDVGLAAMHRALRDFSDRVQDADIAVVFFAGHGIEVNGINYLIPVDAVLERDTDVEIEAVSLDRVTRMLEQAKRLRLVILDACRDNPFVRSMRRTVASRSIGRGLAEVQVPTTDTLIAFAAKAGSTAADGQGSHSPYTEALVTHLATPGLDLRLALGRVRDEVLKSTAKRQEPFVYGSLGGAEIALVTGGPQSRPAPESKAPEIPTATLAPAATPTPALAAPVATKDHPFDGTWTVNFTSRSCPVKSGTYAITVEKSVVSPYGGAVFPTGEATFVTPAIVNKNIKVHHTLKLVGNAGTGQYQVPGTDCSGTEVLRRIGTSQSAR